MGLENVHQGTMYEVGVYGKEQTSRIIEEGEPLQMLGVYDQPYKPGRIFLSENVSNILPTGTKSFCMYRL